MPSPTEIRSIAVDAELSDELRDWMQSVSLGFNGKQLTDKQLQNWHEDLQRTPARVRGAYLPGSPVALPGPVATFYSFDGALNTGAEVVPANFITSVTVRASHTRRRLMSSLMQADLTEARDRGQLFAALTATEATIYGRFGFGISTRHTRIELDTRAGFALKPAAAAVIADTRLEIADPAHPGVKEALESLSGGFVARHRGAHARTTSFIDSILGTFDWDSGERDAKLRCLVTLADDDRITGVLTYTVNHDDNKLAVHNLIAERPADELALWNYLGSHDLTPTVTAHCVDLDDGLRWALADPRRLTLTDHKDGTYLRILDLRRALELRGWDRDGEACLEVNDPLDLCGGRVTVSVKDGHVSVTEGGDDPVSLGIDTLATLYFGDVGLATLAQVGLVTGSEPAIAAADRLFAVDLPPRNRSHW